MLRPCVSRALFVCSLVPLSQTSCHLRLATAFAASDSAASAAASTSRRYLLLFYLYVQSLCVPFLRNKHRWQLILLFCCDCAAPQTKAAAHSKRAGIRKSGRERESSAHSNNQQQQQQQAADSRQTKRTGFLRFIFALAQKAPLPCCCLLPAAADSPSGHAPRPFAAYYITTEYLLLILALKLQPTSQ